MIEKLGYKKPFTIKLLKSLDDELQAKVDIDLKLNNPLCSIIKPEYYEKYYNKFLKDNNKILNVIKDKYEQNSLE